VAGSNQRVAARFASTDNNYGPRFGLIMRYRDALNYYMCYRMTGGTSVLRISKVVDGLEIVLKSAPIASPAKDAMFQLTCSSESSTLTLALGSSSLTVSDSSFSNGSVGLVMGSVWPLGGKGPSHRADDFRLRTVGSPGPRGAAIGPCGSRHRQGTRQGRALGATAFWNWTGAFGIRKGL
jgi:hypothetical protein